LEYEVGLRILRSLTIEGHKVIAWQSWLMVLARVGIGVIVRKGTPPPDISTSDAVRKMLVDARELVWPDAGTPVGSHLDRVTAQLGIADQVRSKLIGHAAFFQNNEQAPEYAFVTDRTRAFLESLAQ